jgi:hypothetical protein
LWSQAVAVEQLPGQLAAMEADSLPLQAGHMAVMLVELLVHNRRAVHLVRAVQEHQMPAAAAVGIGAAAAAHNMQVAVVARHTRRQEFMALYIHVE